MSNVLSRGRLLRAVLGVLVPAFGAEAQGLQPGGPETAVNVYTSGDQSKPSVACSSSGPCVVVWTSLGQDGSPYSILFRRFDADGVPSGGEGVVATSSALAGAKLDVCMDASGAFNVAWDATSSVPGDDADVLVRRYDGAGTPLGAAFVAHAVTTGYQFSPKVACAADGRFVVAWEALDAMLDTDWGVFAQRFDSAGVADGSRIHLNDVTPDFQFLEGLSSTPAGDFAVLWSDRQAPPETTALRLRRFDAAGVPAGPSTVVVQNQPDNPPFQGSHWIRGADVTHDASGELLVAWSEIYFACYDELGEDCEYEPGDVWLRRYAADGSPIDFSREFGGRYRDGVVQGWIGPVVAAGARAALVAWGSSSDASTPDESIDVRPLVLETDVAQAVQPANVSVTGDRLLPAIAAASGERFLAAWVADGQDTSGLGVAARYFCYDSDGDGACDVADPCPLDALDDADADGFCGDVDNCPAISNAGQQDADGDTRGDACEACPGFDDTLDLDADAVPDGCDACPADPDNDSDVDSVCGDVDNCPQVANTMQDEGDGDGFGDACDTCAGGDDSLDTDGDGNPDDCDDCSLAASEGGLLTKAKLSLRKINNGVTGDDRLSLRGLRNEHAYQARPDLHGARVVLLSSQGVRLVDAMLPPGIYAGTGTVGWRVAANGSWSFRDGTASPVDGILRLNAKQGSRNDTSLSIVARGGDYPVQPEHAPLGISVEIGDVSTAEGICTEKRFLDLECESAAGGTSIRCR